MRHDIVRIAAVVSGLICAAGGLALGDLPIGRWVGEPYTLAVPTHITGAGQAHSGSLVLTLEHNRHCTITVSVANAGDEVLTFAGDTLATSYKLTGAGLVNGDADWVASSTFLTRNYDLRTVGPSDQITIWVQAAASSSRANNAGTYSASVILTASW